MVDLYDEFRNFKSFEVIFDDKDGHPQKLLCTVQHIENDKITVHADNKKNKGIVACVGDNIILHIYTENGIYTSTSSIYSVDSGIVNTNYVIAYPTHIKHSQRREYFRAKLKIKFTMTITLDENSNTAEVYGETR